MDNNPIDVSNKFVSFSHFSLHIKLNEFLCGIGFLNCYFNKNLTQSQIFFFFLKSQTEHLSELNNKLFFFSFKIGKKNIFLMHLFSDINMLLKVGFD